MIINKETNKPITHDDIFEAGGLSEHLQPVDNWAGTQFEGYMFVSPKQKGQRGEQYTENMMTLTGHKVEKPENTGHDRIINGIKTEIKFSLALSNKSKHGKLIEPGSWIFNHIAIGKDWDRIILIGINPSPDNPRQTPGDIGKSRHEINAYYMDKSDFEDNTSLFNRQQSGKDGGNDDFMISSKKFLELVESGSAKPIEEW